MVGLRAGMACSVDEVIGINPSWKEFLACRCAHASNLNLL
jgi:hypothetical protein